MWLQTPTRSRWDRILGPFPSSIKTIIYTLRGYKIGRRVKFARGAGVGGRNVKIGDGSVIGAGSFIRGEDVQIERNVIIGERTIIKARRIELRDGARITSRVRVLGFEHPGSAFTMGRNSILMYDSYVDSSRSVHIGDDAGVGGYCLLFTHAAWLSAFEGYPVEFADIIIGDGAWLPWRITMLPGSRVGAGAVIGTHSVVRSSIPDRCLAVGTPARVIRGPDAFTRPNKVDSVALFRRVLDDFVGCVQIHGIEIRRNSNIWEFIAPRQRFGRARTERALICEEEIQSLSGAAVDLLLSLAPVGMELRCKLDEQGISWLDMEARQRSASLPRAGKAFVEFVVRYGVRFTTG